MDTKVKFPNLFDESEAAKRLGVSRRTLRRYRQAGELPFVRVGAFVKYTPECIQKYVERRTRNMQQAA